MKQVHLLSKNKILTLEDWTRHSKHWPGRNSHEKVMSRVFSEGCDMNSDVHVCQVSCGTLRGLKPFCGLPYKKNNLKDIFPSVFHANS